MTKRSVITRNFVLSVIVIMALLIIIPVITLLLLRQTYDERIRTETARVCTSIRQTSRAFIDGAYSLTYELAVNPSILTLDPEIQVPILVDCVQRNDYLELLYIQDMNGDQMARSSGQLGYRGGRAWFLQMKENMQPFVYHSYYSIATGRPCTSIFVPMYVNSEPVGIFGSDISLHFFQQLAEQFADEANGRMSFIIDGEGIVVAHPDVTLLETLTNYKTQIHTIPVTDQYGNNLLNDDGSIVTQEREYKISEGLKSVVDTVLAGSNGLKLIDIDGITYYAGYELIEMPGDSDSWAVITLQDQDIAMTVISQLVNRVFIIIAIIFAAFIVIAFGFFGSLNKAMASLVKARDEAQQANKSKSAFLSTMSHEIRTPLNAILGITEIQLQNEKLPPEVRTGLEKTYSSGDLLLAIINDILDLSKIEAGKLELITAEYETASLISDAVSLNMMRMGSKPIEFELLVDENIPCKVTGDALRVKQILNNILSNAFKYTDEGQVTLSIGLHSNGNQDINDIEGSSGSVTLVFTVRDTGQGMTRDQVERLYDDFSRFNQEANRTTEGTGLGMGITRNLVKMMNGDISVKSEKGKGTEVTIHIPQGKADTEVLGKEKAENLQRFRTQSHTQMRSAQITREYMPYGHVLVVDDVETNIYVATGLLSPYGLKIDTAQSGPEAINKIKSGKVYDIIFMDHMMPDMDGIETTARIRALGYEKPVIALTANAVSGQAEIFLNSGFDDFISKPIDMRQMNASLNKFLRDKQTPEVLEAARREADKNNAMHAGLQSDDSEKKSNVSPQLIKMFLRDAKKALSVLEAFCGKSGDYDDIDVRSLTIHVHGLKSTLAIIGRQDLSDTALRIETYGRDNDAENIIKILPSFISSIRILADELKDAKENIDIIDESKEDKGYLHGNLLVIKEAIKKYNIVAADNAINKLKEKPWSMKTHHKIDMIAEHLLHSDFGDIRRIINETVDE